MVVCLAFIRVALLGSCPAILLAFVLEVLQHAELVRFTGVALWASGLFVVPAYFPSFGCNMLVWAVGSELPLTNF